MADMAASSNGLPPSRDVRTEPEAPQGSAAEDAPTAAAPDVAAAPPAGDGGAGVDEDEAPVATEADRVERLLALRRAIVSGTYAVNARRIARRLVDDL